MSTGIIVGCVYSNIRRAELKAKLGVEDYQAARERGKAFDLETTVVELLGE